MHKAVADDRYTISAKLNVSAVNRDAISRAKKILAATCVSNAQQSDDSVERDHMLDVARLAGASVSIHLGEDNTADGAAKKLLIGIA